MHRLVMADSGTEAAVRDVGLVASAVSRPAASAFGQDAYPTIFLKAAAMMHSLGRNHAFVDGNKRIAWVATETFLLLNRQRALDVSDIDAEVFVLAVVAGAYTVEQTAEWLEWHSRV